MKNANPLDLSQSCFMFFVLSRKCSICVRGLTKYCTELPPKCNPVRKSASTGTLPLIKQVMVRRCSLPSQQPSNARRRVIFPSLHQPLCTTCTISKEETPSPKNDPKPACRSRVPSLGSTNDLDANHPLAPLSRLANKGKQERDESSPKCVSFSEVDALPTILNLGPAAPELWKIDLSAMLIPPFKRTLTPDQDLSREVIDAPSYRKGMITPYNLLFGACTIAVPLVKSKAKRPEILKSILRNKSLESVPSMVSSEQSCDAKQVAFDARVRVFEFQRDQTERKTAWYSPSEMEIFKRQAIGRLSSYTELIPTSTGQLVRKKICNRTLFSHPALQLGGEDEDEVAIRQLARLELQNILIVDPHDLCSKLFAKALKQILPHANVVTAKSSDEAMNRLERCGTKNHFDLILVEERLKLIHDREDHHVSGSALIRLLMDEFSRIVPKRNHPLFVGVSAHYEKDKEKLQQSGASFCWPKPPPPVNKAMRDKILQQILLLRGKHEDALKFFL